MLSLPEPCLLCCVPSMYFTQALVEGEHAILQLSPPLFVYFAYSCRKILYAFDLPKHHVIWLWNHTCWAIKLKGVVLAITFRILSQAFILCPHRP